MIKLIKTIHYEYLRFIIRHFGPCFYGHKNAHIVQSEMTNCVYECKRCGKFWFAY